MRLRTCIDYIFFSGKSKFDVQHLTEVEIMMGFKTIIMIHNNKGWFPSQTIADHRSQVTGDRKESCFHIIAKKSQYM